METITKLLEKGYDVEIEKLYSAFDDSNNWFDKVYWDEYASGKIRKIEGLTEREWPELFQLFEEGLPKTNLGQE